MVVYYAACRRLPTNQLKLALALEIGQGVRERFPNIDRVSEALIKIEVACATIKPQEVPEKAMLRGTEIVNLELQSNGDGQTYRARLHMLGNDASLQAYIPGVKNLQLG